MNADDKSFLQNYQKISFNTTDRLKNDAAYNCRQCLAQMHNHALMSLDEETVCHQLEQKLSSYTDLLNQGNLTSDLDSRVKSVISQRNSEVSKPLKSDLSSVDIKSLLKPLPCQQNKAILTCAKSEQSIRNDFQSFVEVLQRGKPTKPLLLKERKILKNFAPQSCALSGKEQKMPRTSTSENVIPNATSGFITAAQELYAQNAKKYATTSSNPSASRNLYNVNNPKRTLGIRRKPNSKFVPPLLSYNSNDNDENLPKSEEWTTEIDERLKNIDPKMVELIKSEIMDVSSTVEWDDIAGLEFAKTAIQEAVIWPMLRPDIFKGLRRPPKGILLFGPPGTGKTLIGKCVASQSKSTFFSISASSLTSKWVGDGEKMVRALFAVARCYQPAVIFIDEIDSLLSQRSDTEHESSRRIKTEFLVQLDGATTDNEERLLVIGATNRPQELDEAARRRFVKRLYIPLPEFKARLQLTIRLVANERHELTEDHYKEIAQLSAGYSGADIKNLCSEASLGPIRSISIEMMEKIQPDEVRPLMMEDFTKAFERVRSSVSPADLNQYVTWDKTYGSGL